MGDPIKTKDTSAKTVRVCFSNFLDCELDVLRPLVGHYVKPGRTHVTDLNSFGVQYMCATSEDVRVLLNALGGSNKFCKVENMATDNTGNVTVFATHNVEYPTP